LIYKFWTAKIEKKYELKINIVNYF